MLPPFALTGKCCDSVNPHCEGMLASESMASENFWEREVLRITGRDQCDGTFVEVGGGDGITDSLTLYFEKVMGWRGIIFEGDAAKYAALAASGRQVRLVNAHVAGAGPEHAGAAGAGHGERDLREVVGETLDLADEAQTVQLVVVNVEGAAQVRVLRALNTSMVPGRHGMPAALSNMIAVVRDESVKDEVAQVLQEKSYVAMEPDGDEGDEEAAKIGRGVAGGPGRTWQLFLWSPSMEDMVAAGGCDRGRVCERVSENVRAACAACPGSSLDWALSHSTDSSCIF